MAEIKIAADSGGGSVSWKGPSSTTSNAAVQLTLPVDDGPPNQYLKTDGSGALSWATVSSTPEGTAILSTGETNGTKYLREDGDGTCSWQTVSSGAALTGSTDNQITTDTGANAIQGESGLTYNGTKLAISGQVEGSGATTTHSLPTTVDSWGWRLFNNTSSSPYGLEIKYPNKTRDDNLGEFINCLDASAIRFKVTSDGDVWNHDDDYGGSDQTLKENIVDATSKLEDLKKLKVRNFNWKSEYFPERSKRKMIGFIAQEVEEVFPSMISEYNLTGDNDNPVMKKAIKKSWGPILVKALQEAVAKIEVLETKVAALEAG